MNYDFDTVRNRRGTNSLKWDIPEGELPMWVADMDFQTAPAIRKAIEKKTSTGIFGYGIIPDAWYDAYITWWKDRYAFSMKREWLLFCAGIIPAISSILRRMTDIQDYVIVQTPVYNNFFTSITENGRRVLENPLKFDGENYEIDFEDLEEKLAYPQTTMMLLCNPHNPVGRIWSREELEQIGALCEKYHVLVISDEIHCDLTEPGCNYVPFASVSELCQRNSITCIAPTKTFNIAGIQTAAVSVPRETLRDSVKRAIEIDGGMEPNAFAVEAAVAAYTEGAPWLCALREYVSENKKYVTAFLRREIQEIKAIPSEATYLMWLDCRKISIEEEGTLADVLRKKSGLYLVDGSKYGESGRGFLRLNAACPRATLAEGMERLSHFVKNRKRNLKGRIICHIP